MPKYWGKQIFTHGSFPEVGQKQKTEEKRKDWTMAITMASYASQTPPWVAHAKLPGPSFSKIKMWQSGPGIKLIKPLWEMRAKTLHCYIFLCIFYCDFHFKIKMTGHGERKYENYWFLCVTFICIKPAKCKICGKKTNILDIFGSPYLILKMGKFCCCCCMNQLGRFELRLHTETSFLGALEVV